MPAPHFHKDYGQYALQRATNKNIKTNKQNKDMVMQMMVALEWWTGKLNLLVGSQCWKEACASPSGSTECNRMIFRSASRKALLISVKIVDGRQTLRALVLQDALGFTAVPSGLHVTIASAFLLKAPHTSYISTLTLGNDLGLIWTCHLGPVKTFFYTSW